MRDARLRTLIDTASTGVVPAGVTLLRRVDVVLWRWGTYAGIPPSLDEETNP